MSTHETRLAWTLGERPFRHEGHGRAPQVFLADRPLEVPAAKACRGNLQLTNPEEQLVAVLPSCHMPSFLTVAVKRGLEVQRHDDRAVGTLGKNDEGHLAITSCVLHPRIALSVPVEGAELEALHERAHHACFIAQSCKTVVTIESGV